MAREPGVLAPPAAEPSPQPQPTIAQYPGVPVELPIILWVGAGKFFQRLVKEKTFDELLTRHGAHLTVIDLRGREDIVLLPEHGNVRYYDVSDSVQRRDLLYNAPVSRIARSPTATSPTGRTATCCRPSSTRRSPPAATSSSPSRWISTSRW